MATSSATVRFSWLQFSLRTLAIALTLTTVAFGYCWQLPIVVTAVPIEFVPGKKPRVMCLTGVDPKIIAAQNLQPASARCIARRSGWSEHQLHGQAEIYDRTGPKIIEAQYVRGQLEGPYRSWFVNGQPREIGEYLAGKQHGKWQHFDLESGKLGATCYYERGAPVGTWTDGSAVKTTYRNGLRWQEELRHSAHLRRVTEYDDQEKIAKITIWGESPTEPIGLDLFRAGQRHGPWYRKDANEHLRGQWVDGRAEGEWILDRGYNNFHTLKFRHGELLALDGEPVNDHLTRQLANQAALESRAGKQCSELLEKLQHVIGIDHAPLTREEIFGIANDGADLPPLQVDPRLIIDPEELKQLWQRHVSLRCAHGPVSAELVLALQGTGLVLDYRLECLWLTTPELARAWKDETGVLDWYYSLSEKKQQEYLIVRSSFTDFAEFIRYWNFGDPPHLVAPKKLPPSLLQLDDNRNWYHLWFHQCLAVGCEIHRLQLRRSGDQLLLVPITEPPQTVRDSKP
ncbi:toxin-antitoxin system YwqK family antitoxin [Anatilimnocola floriformis]|uniref:toxin-antitoxin system YwqK family antitoxin n=1 Tax=Anatilimnocola floriformis TaxID=2948575 RepID=UPI0020C1DDDC|nr:hypothetical protein [Anatilimnocola floriformis]